jgi:hypothetical protein
MRPKATAPRSFYRQVPTISYLVYTTHTHKSYKTSNDPSQQFSAPFKAGNYRQVQTCYKPTAQAQRKLQHFLVHTSTGEMGVLNTLNHRASAQRCLLLKHAIYVCVCQKGFLHNLQMGPIS